MMKHQPYQSKDPFSSRRSKVLLIFAAITLASGWTVLHIIDLQRYLDTSILSWNKSSDHHASFNNDTDNDILKPAISHLDPNTKYLSYLPFAGLTNQFIALEVAAYTAKRLNRTLIIPPIITNTHNHENTHQRWSQFLDLPRFTELTGLTVLEWDTVRPLDAHQHQAGQDHAQMGRARGGQNPTAKRWNSVAENITCQIVYGYGAPDLNVNISGMNFLWHFLFRATFVDPPSRKPEIPFYDRKKYAQDNQHSDEDLIVMEDLVARYRDYDDSADINNGGYQILFLSHTFKVKDPEYGNRRYWMEIGQHLHFVPQVMEYVTDKMNEEVQGDHEVEMLPNDDPEEVHTEVETNTNKTPRTRIPHIAIHLRRGDIWKKCSEADKNSCIIPFDYYVHAVQRARALIASSSSLSINAEHMPVIVTTDTDSEDDLRQIKEHGWHTLDHEKYETARIWGPFGPAMIDSAILAHADVLIGSSKSTMSRIAALRQRTWYKRETIYSGEKDTKQKRMLLTRRSSNGMGKRRMDMEEENDDDVVLVY
ncbi:hypothetical protein BG011_007648 [Mortierella polycephala]|uniref:GDP-fucose protein O-fucosyltransferase 2 n=1 Tax=Mortierella polycephala TaxID=41804 RepID=A0A9P6UA50_9FUNG|nr:hypothetical protein BG011_007648 [Mortierella polycephala]